MRNLHLNFDWHYIAMHRTEVRWRFRKILLPSQNIWTLLTLFLNELFIKWLQPPMYCNVPKIDFLLIKITWYKEVLAFLSVYVRGHSSFFLNFQLLMYSIGQVFAHSGELVQKNTNQVQADVGSEHMYRIVATEKKRFFDFHLITMRWN